MKKNYIVSWGTVVREIRDGRPAKCNWGEIWRMGVMQRDTGEKPLQKLSLSHLLWAFWVSLSLAEQWGPDVVCTVCPHQACPLSCLIHWKCSLPPSSIGNAFCFPSLALLSKQGLLILCALSWHTGTSWIPSLCPTVTPPSASACVPKAAWSLLSPRWNFCFSLWLSGLQKSTDPLLTLLTEHIMSLCLAWLILCRVPYQCWLFIEF